MATEILTKVTIDCSTGEQITEPLTAEEISALEASRAQAEVNRAAAEAEATAKAEAKASALAKLAALGLTEEEAAALAG
jgi:regulator of protease activity HflC (stomatin/prohibitin superfamily)